MKTPLDEALDAVGYEAGKRLKDLIIYGTCLELDGKHIPHKEIYKTPLKDKDIL